MIKYQCRYDEKTWANELRIISQEIEKCEFLLRYDGNEIDVIVGKSKKSNWICIPIMKLGLELSHFNDKFWNKSALRREIDPISSEAITEAVYKLNEAGIIV